MKIPNKISNPETLRALLDGFIRDYETMEAHVTKQDVRLQKLHNRVVRLRELIRDILKSDSTVPARLRKEIVEQLQKEV